jgi:hypothetical protein
MMLCKASGIQRVFRLGAIAPQPHRNFFETSSRTAVGGGEGRWRERGRIVGGTDSLSPFRPITASGRSVLRETARGKPKYCGVYET